MGAAKITSVAGRGTRERFLASVACGLPLKYAVAASGGSRSTLLRWAALGRELHARLEEGEMTLRGLSREERAALDFAREYEQAKVAAVERLIAVVDAAALEGNWRAAMGRLAQLDREEFAASRRGDDGGGGSVDVQRLIDLLAHGFRLLPSLLNLDDDQRAAMPDALQQMLAGIERAFPETSVTP